eukprot:1232202-Lingulodinium_polyedra.AAC.1
MYPPGSNSSPVFHCPRRRALAEANCGSASERLLDAHFGLLSSQGPDDPNHRLHGPDCRAPEANRRRSASRR